MPDRRVTAERWPEQARAREGEPFGGRGWDLYLVAAAMLLPFARPAGPGGLSVLDVLNAVALAVFLGAALRRRAHVRFLFALPMLVIFTRSLLAVTNAVSVSASCVSMLVDAYLYLWVVILVALLSRRGDLAGVRVAWLAAASAVALGSLAAAFAARQLSLWNLLTARGPRLSGAFPNANMFADYLVFSVFIALGLIGRVRAGILLASLGLLGLALLSTKSNGGMVSLSAGLAVWFPARAWYGGLEGSRLAGRVALALAPLLLAGLLISESGPGSSLVRRVQEHSFLARISHSSASRRDIWRPLERSYVKSPLGLGPGNSAFQKVEIGERERPDSFLSKEAHNDYLAYAVERGPIALLAMLAWTGQVFGMALAARVRPGRQPADARRDAALLASFLGALVATSLHSMVIEKLHFRHVWLFLGLVCAVTGSVAARETAAARPVPLPRPGAATRLGAPAVAMRGRP